MPLGKSLADGATTMVQIRYSATLRSTLTGSNWLFTKANGVMDLYRWLPWVSRRIAFDRPNHGDPFMTPSSPLVKVRIVADRKLVFATTGDRIAATTDGLSQTFQARNVRDFTVTAATDYRTGSRVVDGTTVRVWYRPGSPGSAMLDAAADAFHLLRARLGAYPYPVFKVVESAGGYGMESPALIWIPHGVGSANLRYLAAHETAHQWFYGLVGNDQSSQPFADEAAADFAARSVLGLRRGEPLLDVHAGPLDLRLHLGLLLRDDLHPGRQPARRRPPEDGLVRVLGRAPRVHRGQPLRDRGHALAAGCARCGDAARPVVDDVRPAIPAGSPRRRAARQRAHRRPAPSASAARSAG